MFGFTALSQAPFSTLAGGVVYQVAVDENVLSNDAVSALQGFSGIAFETAQASDAQSARLPISVSVQAESAFGADSYITRGFLSIVVNELGTVVDATSVNGSLIVQRSELAVGNSTQSAAAAFRGARAESVTASDAEIARLIKTASVLEIATGQDAIASRPNYRVLRSEVATGTDSLNTNFSVIARAVELALAQMTATTNAAVKSSRSETATGTAVNTGNANFAVRRQENATIFDLPAGRRLWEPVNDTQDPNWVIIPTTPT